MMVHQKKPHFPLADIQALVASWAFVIEPPASRGLEDLEWDDEDCAACIAALKSQHYHKPTVTEKGPHKGKIQDVYRCPFQGERIYMKLQIEPAVYGIDGPAVAVISFTRDQAYE